MERHKPDRARHEFGAVRPATGGDLLREVWTPVGSA